MTQTLKNGKKISQMFLEVCFSTLRQGLTLLSQLQIGVTLIRGTMFDEITTTKALLADIEKRFIKNEKAEVNSTILKTLISLRYKVNGNIREYIIEMSYLA